MKTVAEVLATPTGGWEEDQYGLVMKLDSPDQATMIEIRIEPLLWGAAHLAVYINGIIWGEKVPITLGTPAHNGHKEKLK